MQAADPLYTHASSRTLVHACKQQNPCTCMQAAEPLYTHANSRTLVHICMQQNPCACMHACPPHAPPSSLSRMDAPMQAHIHPSHYTPHTTHTHTTHHSPHGTPHTPHPTHPVLFLQRQRKAIDDGPQDLQQLCNSVVVLRLKDKAVKHIVDGLPDERPVHHELAVDAVQDGLQVVALAGVLAVKQL
eukprot:17680-Chlamydomonas_euryale.AAC.1